MFAVTMGMATAWIVGGRCGKLSEAVANNISASVAETGDVGKWFAQRRKDAKGPCPQRSCLVSHKGTNVPGEIALLQPLMPSYE
jgi:hypothetical protein